MLQSRALLVCVLAAITLVTGEDSGKRAPSGFLGMRGKKNFLALHPSSYEESELRDSIKRAPSGFLGMRGKKLMSDNELDDIGDWDKRAPMGFQGMRGKKDYFDDEDEGSYALKRAPMGFQGMRGKKFYSYDTSDDYPYDDEYELNPYKRAPMGFQGMRGKKLMEKRAPSGFLGMRGKKQPRAYWSSKSMPFDFRGKFVAVRGKKVSEEVLSQEDDEEATRSLRGLLQELEKRAKPSGFLGMRGKKSAEAETTLTENDQPRQ